jgi:hypothetical protein
MKRTRAAKARKPAYKSVAYSYVEGYEFPFNLEVLDIADGEIKVDISKKFRTYREFLEAMEAVVQLLPEGEPTPDEEEVAYA